jgi:hypothetical protein
MARIEVYRRAFRGSLQYLLYRCIMRSDPENQVDTQWSLGKPQLCQCSQPIPWGSRRKILGFWCSEHAMIPGRRWAVAGTMVLVV